MIYPGTLSWVHTHPSAKMDLKVKASGRSKTHYDLVLFLDFGPQGAFLSMYSVSLVPKGFAHFVLAVTITLNTASTITLSVYKRETLAIYPVAIVTSTWEGKQETDCKCLNWSPFVSGLRKC